MEIAKILWYHDITHLVWLTIDVLKVLLCKIMAIFGNGMFISGGIMMLTPDPSSETVQKKGANIMFSNKRFFKHFF